MRTLTGLKTLSVSQCLSCPNNRVGFVVLIESDFTLNSNLFLIRKIYIVTHTHQVETNKVAEVCMGVKFPGINNLHPGMCAESDCLQEVRELSIPCFEWHLPIECSCR